MSRSMTMTELSSLVKLIGEQNSPFTARGDRPSIKYVDPHIDMRTMDCFSLQFRGFGSDDITFHVCNEHRENPRSLFERCVRYLETGEVT